MNRGMNRREFSQALVGAIASYALLEALVSRDAFAGPVRPITGRWVRNLNAMSQDLRTGTITPRQWQGKVDELFDQVDQRELLALVDFDKLTRGFEYPDRGVATRAVRFPRLGGIPEDLAFYSKIFGMKKDRAIIPHGHKNMVSCHYVLTGRFQLRQYEKVSEDGTHMLIEPTVDEVARIGSHSSISDEKNNIHWLKALSDTAFTFDVIIQSLRDAPVEIDNIDPYGAEKVSGNRLRVRKLGVEEALKKYGHDTHHR
jgi:hypothetical protein